MKKARCILWWIQKGPIGNDAKGIHKITEFRRYKIYFIT